MDEPTEPTPLQDAQPPDFLDLPYYVQAAIARVEARNDMSVAAAQLSTAEQILSGQRVAPPNYNPQIAFTLADLHLRKADTLLRLCNTSLKLAEAFDNEGDPKSRVSIQSQPTPPPRSQGAPISFKSNRSEPRGIS